MTKNELKNMIRECINEVEAESKPMTFDEAWDHAEKAGVPILEVTEKQWNLFMEDVVTNNSCDNVKLLLED